MFCGKTTRSNCPHLLLPTDVSAEQLRMKQFQFRATASQLSVWSPAKWRGVDGAVSEGRAVEL